MGVGLGSCLEFQKDKSDNKENNISTFSTHKNILQETVVFEEKRIEEIIHYIINIYYFVLFK